MKNNMGASSGDDRVVVNGAGQAVSTLRASTPSVGDLKVWWIPQIPMQAFEVAVADLQSAALLLDTLAAYDLFQFENNVKPDYCNAGGLVQFEIGPDGGEWSDYWDDATNADFDELRRDPSLLAKAIEARSDETGTGSTVGESAALQGSPESADHE